MHSTVVLSAFIKKIYEALFFPYFAASFASIQGYILKGSLQLLITSNYS